MAEHKYGEIRKVINELLSAGGEVISKKEIISMAVEKGFSKEEARKAIRHYIEEGTLVELDEETVEVPV